MNYHLPDGCVVVAASNPASERGVRFSMPRLLRNRFGFAARQGGGFFAGNTEIEAQLLEGTIGQAATIELVGFLRLFRQLPSIPEILLNPDTAPVPDEPSSLIAIATALGRVLHPMNKHSRAWFASRRRGPHDCWIIPSSERCCSAWARRPAGRSPP